jgi:hypothetical protein
MNFTDATATSDDHEDLDSDLDSSTASETPSLAAFHEGAFGTRVETFFAHHFEIEESCVSSSYMEGGSFNRILALDIDATKHKGDSNGDGDGDGDGGKKERMVLRLPRTPARPTDLLTNIATHAHLHTHAPLALRALTTCTVAHDVSANNSLCTQWVLQRRLPGVPLDYVLHRLGVHARTSLAMQLAHVLSDVLAVPFAGSGRLVADQACGDGTHGLVPAPPRIVAPPSNGAFSFGGALDQDGADYVQGHVPAQGLLGFFQSNFRALGTAAQQYGNEVVQAHCAALEKVAVLVVERYEREIEVL